MHDIICDVIACLIGMLIVAMLRSLRHNIQMVDRRRLEDTPESPLFVYCEKR